MERKITSLLYKPDWPQAAEKMEKWWRKESFGRPPLLFHGLKREPLPIKEPESIEKKWLDVDYRLDRAESLFEASSYPAEEPPYFSFELGSTPDAAFFGAGVEFAEGTVWYHPCINDWSRTPPFEFDEENRWWKVICQATERACERARGKYLVGIPALGGPGDTLAVLRGANNLLMDLADNPDEVVKRMEQLTGCFSVIYKKLWALLQEYQVGGTNWWPTWGRNFSFIPQNDFSIMISPVMFKEFFLPSIKKLTREFPNSVYHLDGPGALVHAEALSGVENIRAIMYCEGAGNGPIMRWFDALRKIQARGMSVAQGFPAGAEIQMLENLDPQKMLLVCSTGPESDIETVFQNICSWFVTKRR
jgi:hypothetical protein